MKKKKLRESIYEVVYGTDTPAGKRFDLALIWLILASILTVCLESIPAYKAQYFQYFQVAEWMFTFCFTIEYFLRIYCHHRPLRYVFSFYGIIDLLSVLPTLLTAFVPGLHYLVTIRILRLLRIFRILKLTSFMHNAQLLTSALVASMQKIMVFMLTVVSLVLIIGTVMYVVEGEKNGFTSIPKSIYWAIVTITTVGYGDLTPQTTLGQIISSIVMIMGYAIIAVPTGIVTVELSKGNGPFTATSTMICSNCNKEISTPANFCSHCGHKLVEKTL